ncbi:MAG: transposase family protein [Oscillospiraceae bacterium]|nr:transposase family protein [Oscillospiraceae bacterium]
MSVHIYILAKKTAKYQCPECGQEHSRLDNEEERVWQHGDVVFYPCFIHCRRPRVKCERSGKIHVVEAPWSRKGSRYTMLFESFAMKPVEKLPFEQARKSCRSSRRANFCASAIHR